MTGLHAVLDLDATVVHTEFVDERKLKDILTNPYYDSIRNRIKVLKIIDIDDNFPAGNGHISIAVVILRPHIEEFINFILEYFDNISIWSAGHKRYVRAIESVLFSHDNILYNRKLKKVLTRQDCNEVTSKSVLKDLESRGFILSNTIIIDDNKKTFVNNPNNAIHIPIFLPKINEVDEDKSLLRIIDWLKKNNLRECKDVRNIDKTHIFD